MSDKPVYQNLYQIILSKSPVGIAIYDQSGQCVEANESIVKFVGATKEQVLQQNYNNIESWKKSGLLYEAQNAIKDQSNKRHELIIESTFGKIVRLDCHLVPFLSGSLLLMVNDITENKLAENRLRESEEKFRNLFSSCPMGIFIYKLEDNDTLIFQDANKEADNILGVNCRQFIGKTLEEAFPLLVDTEIPERYKSAAAEGKIWKTEQVDYSHGEISGAFKVVAFQTKPNEMACIFEDISERKRTESELQEAFSIINRSPAVAFLWKNLEGWPVEFVSDNVIELFGYAAEEFTSGQVTYAKTVHPDDLERVAGEVATFSNEKERTGFVHKPYRIISKDGKVRWLDDRTYIRRDTKGNITHYEGIVVDITDSMQAAEALQENKEKLARSKKMESLGLLAGGVAHDLNNVLSGIVSYPELLLLELPEDSQFRKAIETIKESGDRAVAIVQDLLTVARGVATTKEPLNLNDLIGDYLHSPEYNKLKQFHPTVTVKTNLDADLLNIIGSHVHIRKVIMNLVSNASEAIEGGGNVAISTVNRYIDKPLRGYDDIRTGEYAVLAVSDDGSGISLEDLERIFEPFYTKKVMGRSGTGLGLAVVWNVVQDHQGYIDVQSTENGTRFELYFPITREAVEDRESPMPIGDYKGAGETILVVDDVETQREIACKMLNTLGYKTKAVSSGEEAVTYLQERTVDLILLDMIMDPGISGRETYEKIIKIHPEQKAVIVSGFAETDEVREAQRLGAGPYIKKPFTLEKIGFAIKYELKKK